MSDDASLCVSTSKNDPNGSKSGYETFFTYEHTEGGKQGTCRICAKKNKVKVIKMKNSNTTGLKKHLKNFHDEEFKQLFPSIEPTQNKKANDQKTLESCFSVNNFCLFFINLKINLKITIFQ